jgi:hypothetical protein
MRIVIIVFAALLASCGSAPQPEVNVSPKKQAAPKPSDESRRLPKTNLVETKVVERELMGKPFMPGGTLARYKNGKTEYEIFIAKLGNAQEAAFLLPDWRKALADSKFVPSFGGYFGTDAGRPVFVFAKGAWIAGIAGLSEKAADGEARTLAGQLN